jgi:hypothetical protein
VLEQGLKGMSLGMLVALGLGLVDVLWNVSLRRVIQVGLRMVLAVIGGGLGGFLGGMAGQAMLDYVGHAGESSAAPMLRVLESGSWVLGWTLTGILIGASLCVFDLLACLASPANWRGAVRKIRNCILGGTLGGMLGGILSLFLRLAWGRLFRDRPTDLLWSPSAMGFVALGACIGLLIGLAQVILKDAWVKVEAGFRAGREMILSKAETTIGRAEACDIGLFGDALVDRIHARILRQGGRYFLAHAGDTSGTLLNGSPVNQPTPLRSGDAIRLGNSVLRFWERARRGE